MADCGQNRRRQNADCQQAVAEFWVSRVHRNEDGSYSIINVVGADEYAENVDDNAFTNGAAKRVLRDVTKAAEVLGKPVDPRWMEISDNLVFTYDADGVTMEYTGYDGRLIKQTDVNMLAYPLGVVTDPEQTLRDINYYFPFTEPSAEMDISCHICGGKGCPFCKGTGWVEILGCGMVDPNVLELNGIDSSVYSGYALGMGIERITNLKYQVKDLRMFSENDVRFLKEFESAY